MKAKYTPEDIRELVRQIDIFISSSEHIQKFLLKYVGVGADVTQFDRKIKEMKKLKEELTFQDKN